MTSDKREKNVTTPNIDLDLLADHLKAKMTAEDLSLRAAAGQIGCSPATLSRMLRGSAAESFPEGETLFGIIAWLGKSVSDFEKGKRPTATTVNEVEVHLRALPGLDERDIQALVALVRAANDKGMALRSRKP